MYSPSLPTSCFLIGATQRPNSTRLLICECTVQGCLDAHTTTALSTSPRMFYLGSYTGLGAAQSILMFLATFSLVFAGIRASRTLHNTMLERLLRAPMQFFDTTPLGRILNRFSKDMYTVDVEIPNTSDQFLSMLTMVLSTVVAILIAIPIFGLVVVPLGIFYFLVQVLCTVGGVGEILPLLITMVFSW